VKSSHLNEVSLVAEILNKNEEAFKTLVDEFQQKVINICYGFTHQNEDAMDLAQEVFIEVYESISTFRRDAKLSTWIYRIAVNKSLNHLRKSKRNRLLETWDNIFGNGNTENLTPLYDHTDKSYIDMERRKIVNKAIDSLPVAQKTAFTLHKIEDFSYQQISETMKVSVPAVESLMHRAKINLQKKLVNYYKDNL
jgi:RNA polymerase sigma-70 factor, ECF subfamily